MSYRGLPIDDDRVCDKCGMDFVVSAEEVVREQRARFPRTLCTICDEERRALNRSPRPPAVDDFIPEEPTAPIERECTECRASFDVSLREQASLLRLVGSGARIPRRCKDCRRARRSGKAA